MVHTNLSDWEAVAEIGKQIKKHINKKYKRLEIEVDGVYKSMLLLKKKRCVSACLL